MSTEETVVLGEAEIPDNVAPLFKEQEAPEQEASYHSILSVWRAMLDPEQQQRHLPPTPDWCAVLIARWPFLKFSDCGVVQSEYFKIFDMANAIVEAVFADNEDAFNVTDRDADVENKDLYVHILTEFQKSLFVVQSEWRHDDEFAGAKMAALGEAQQQILGKDYGLVSYLAVIELPFTREEQEAMNQELAEFRASLEV